MAKTITIFKDKTVPMTLLEHGDGDTTVVLLDISDQVAEARMQGMPLMRASSGTLHVCAITGNSVGTPLSLASGAAPECIVILPPELILIEHAGDRIYRALQAIKVKKMHIIAWGDDAEELHALIYNREFDFWCRNNHRVYLSNAVSYSPNFSAIDVLAALKRPEEDLPQEIFLSFDVEDLSRGTLIRFMDLCKSINIRLVAQPEVMRALYRAHCLKESK